jgi:hypothetical protein
VAAQFIGQTVEFYTYHTIGLGLGKRVELVEMVEMVNPFAIV